MTGCRDYGDLVGPYILGALEPDEMEEMTKHLRRVRPLWPGAAPASGAARAARRAQADDTIASPRRSSRTPCLTSSSASAPVPSAAPRPWRRFAIPAAAAATMILAVVLALLLPAVARARYARAELWSMSGQVLGNASVAEVEGARGFTCARITSRSRAAPSTSSGACAPTAAGSTAEASTRAATAPPRAAHGCGPARRLPLGRGHSPLGGGSAAPRSCAASSPTEPPPTRPAYNQPCAPSGLTALLCSLAIVAVGCGVTTTATAGRRVSADTQTSGSGGGASDTGGGGAAQTLTLTADPGGALKFDKSTLTAKAGKATVVLDNPPHSRMRSRSRAMESKRRPTPSARTRPRRSRGPETRQYEYYCPVDGHRAAGMEGTLTVQ